MTIMPYKRRRLGKTDYRKRLDIIASNKLRVVVRKSLAGIVVQLVKFQPNGDLVITSANAGELTKFGWGFNKGNTPSAYLTGLLCGVKIIGKSKKDKSIGIELEKGCILDIGIAKHIKGSRIYAALKGIIDAGINIAHAEEALPSQDRLIGKHIETYKKINLRESFDKVKNTILKR